MSDEDLLSQVGGIGVIARVATEDKVRLVRLLKELDNVVAMTGDGAVALAVRCLQKDLSIGVIELGDDPKPMESKETALRVADSRGVSSTHIFNTKGSRGAFADRCHRQDGHGPLELERAEQAGEPAPDNHDVAVLF